MTKFTAYLWQSGHIQIANEVPPGALPLFTGSRQDVEDLLLANTDAELVRPGGEDDRAWLLAPVAEAVNAHEKYVVVMLWLSKLRRLYADKAIEVHVNRAANPDVRRATAQTINSQLH